MIPWVSSSKTEPRLNDKKCLNSLFNFFPAPSAVLEGTDTATLLIWLVRPYFSSGGKHLVME